MTELVYDVVLCILAFAAGHWFGRQGERDRLAPFVAYAVIKLAHDRMHHSHVQTVQGGNEEVRQ